MIVDGINVVRELLNSKTRIEKIISEEGNNRDIDRLVSTARSRQVKVEIVPKKELEKIAKSKTQGIIAFVPNYKYAEVDDILHYANVRGEKPFIVILDGISDPHNLGAIIRTCECAGVHGVIIPENRACEITDTVYRTSAGAVCHMRVSRVTNLTRTIKYLQGQGVWVYALEAGSKSIYEENFIYPTAIVVGSEGKGVSRLVLESVDQVVSMDMFGRVNSLNASNASAIAVYEVVRQRRN